jgi:nucleoside-diphosphate-sugar epimerase
MGPMRRVLVTGSSGFVGNELCRTLAERGFSVRAVVRDQRRAPPTCDDVAVVEKMDGTTPWSRPLDGIDSVVHLAAKAHVQRTTRLREYIEVNADATKCLAVAAAQAGVRRFVLLSSIKVNGFSTTKRPFQAGDEVRPDGPYGCSKWLAERHLAEASEVTRMEAVIVRPPLVYGPGVKANFLTLLRCIDRGWPLPFGSVENARSLVSIWNLSDFIVTLLRNSPSAKGTWLVSDGDDLSTPALIKLIGSAMKRRVRLLPVPVGILRALSAPLGLRSTIERLCGSLVLDMSASSEAFNWKPPLSVREGIDRTVYSYLRGGRS